MTVVRYGRGSVIGPDASHTTWGIVKPQHNELGVRKQVKQRGFATEQEAIAALDEWRVSVNKRMAVESSRLSVADLLAQWLESECSDLRPKTIESYAYSTNHVITRIGGKRAQALEPKDVVALKAVLLRETSDRVAYKALQALRQALGWATRIELVQRNVALLVDLPAYVPEEGIALSHEQARRFLAVAEDATYAPLWLLYLSTGVRRGEGLGLTWADIDWKRHTLSVRRQVTIVKGEDGKATPVLAEVKSRASRRTLDIDARLALALEEHQQAMTQARQREQLYRDRDLIFCTRNGLMLNPNNVLRTFAQLCAATGLPEGFTIHDLRHTHASHLVLAGVPLLEVSKRLGHAKPDITLAKYSHLMPGYVGSSTTAVERALYADADPCPTPLGTTL
jgi:integrase